MDNNKWEKRIDHNAHDLGELGKYIRAEYAKNILADLQTEHKEEIKKLIKDIDAQKWDDSGKHLWKLDWMLDWASVKPKIVAKYLKE